MSEEERLLELEKRADTGTTQKDLEEGYKKKEDAANQRKSLAAIREGGRVKNCPNCRTGIEKISGCNKMHCENCHTKFCWMCLEVITDYDHYRVDELNGPSGCQGKLFEGTEMAMYGDAGDFGGGWIGMQAQGAAYGRPQQRNVTFRNTQCPRCKQMNVKEGKANHIRCWNCRKGYCYRCRESTETTKHFGPKTCPQHSDD